MLCVLFQKSEQELAIYRMRAGVQGIEKMLQSGNLGNLRVVGGW